MKKVIILIMFGFLFGQYGIDRDKLMTTSTNITGSQVITHEEWKFLNETPISVDEKICWTEDEIVTVKDIMNYAEECYNDSIHVYYSELVSCYSDSTTPLNTLMRYNDSTIYINHTIPTLPGFIDWINENK